MLAHLHKTGHSVRESMNEGMHERSSSLLTITVAIPAFRAETFTAAVELPSLPRQLRIVRARTCSLQPDAALEQCSKRAHCQVLPLEHPRIAAFSFGVILDSSPWGQLQWPHRPTCLLSHSRMTNAGSHTASVSEVPT